MGDDPISPLTPASPDGVMSEAPNRPESSADLSESANTQPAPEQPTAPQVQPIVPEAPPASEPPQPSQPEQSSTEQPISISTPSPSEPSTNTPSVQEVPPETEPENNETQTIQADTEPQSQSEPEAPHPQNLVATPSASVIEPSPAPMPPIPSSPSIPSLHFPFYGSYPVTFDFGSQPTDEEVKKKYQEWGLSGHNGLDFGLPTGTEVLACDEGVVSQVGENGDFGISVTLKHSWGTSIYAHLQSFGVLVNDNVSKGYVIGSSDQTGFAKGPHLHFGIQPNNSDTNNGYLGYINPSQYLTEKTEKPQPESSPQPEQQSEPQPPFEEKSADLSEEEKIEEPVVTPPAESQSSVPTESSSPQIPQSPPSPISPVNPQAPVAPQVPLSPQSNLTEADIQRLADEKVKVQWQQFQPKGNPAKKAKHDEAIQKIFAFAQEKKRITNQHVRDLLHISQSTASSYLSQLVRSGILKTEGKGKATVYLF